MIVKRIKEENFIFHILPKIIYSIRDIYKNQNHNNVKAKCVPLLS